MRLTATFSGAPAGIAAAWASAGVAVGVDLSTVGDGDDVGVTVVVGATVDVSVGVGAAVLVGTAVDAAVGGSVVSVGSGEGNDAIGVGVVHATSKLIATNRILLRGSVFM